MLVGGRHPTGVVGTYKSEIDAGLGPESWQATVKPESGAAEREFSLKEPRVGGRQKNQPLKGG